MNTRFIFDALGNLIERQDNQNVTTIYHYEAHGNPIQVEHQQEGNELIAELLNQDQLEVIAEPMNQDTPPENDEDLDVDTIRNISPSRLGS